MIPESVIIEKIVEANENEKLAIFVGAGISKSSDTDKDKMPSWDILIENIKNKINEKDEVDFLKIAQYFYNAVGKDEYYKTIEAMIPRTFSPSKVHKRIFDINPHIIITTNWDSILECANQKHARFFDIVSNDRELVQSVFHHKIIKMHGDFSHKNIVFKESDYLNYENDFPLLSNYIKSVLSTHTVLFIGYSYNDINLKLIIQWLRNNAEHGPDMFLAESRSKSNQIGYLRKQGIETVILSDINNKLDGINDMDQYSKMTYTFLDKIFKGYDPLNLRKSLDIVQYIYNKLKPLDGLNSILVDQIQVLLTNCGFVFDNDRCAILQFYNHLLTGDYDRERRDIYIKFVEILNYTVNGEKPTKALLDIFSIFVKAGIKGIMLEKDDWTNQKQTFITLNSFLEKEINVYKSCNFDFLFSNYILDSENVDILYESSFNLYNLNKIEDAYNLTEKIIEITVSTNDYVKLFIALFNRNNLLKRLKYELTTKDKYSSIEEYDIESRYNNLTSQIKIAVAPVFNFINFSDVYRYLHSSSIDAEKIRKDKRTIDSGGFVYSNDAYKFSGQHINLINFVLTNKIMIEDYSEYKIINKNFVEIALIRQIQSSKIILTRPEVYSCIKYFSSDELKTLFQDYYKEGSDKIGTFDLNEDDKNWLINTVLKNCIDQYIAEDNALYAIFGLYIEKILFILSIVKLSDIDSNNILSLINKLILEKTNGIGIGFFQSVNLFLRLQYNIYKTSIEKQVFIDLFETLINKINDKKINGYEFIALSENYLSNLYGYASVAGVIFENADIINNLLTSIEEFGSEAKLGIIQNFILNIYQISNDTIKTIIKDYVLSFKLEDDIPFYKRILYNNALVILGIKEFTKENFNELKTFIEPYTKDDSFTSILYGMNSQIEYMITKLKIKELEDISSEIKEIIKKYQENKRRSIF